MRFPRAGRVSLAAVGSIAVALAAVACSSSGSTTPATTAANLETTNIVVGALPVVDTAGLYLAQQEGYFKQEGLNVTISPIAASPDAIPEMEHGQVEIVAGANYVSFFQAQAAGKGPFKVLVDGTSCSTDTFEILALPDSNITSAADLAGKTIAVNTLNNIQTMLINTTLQTAGVDPKTVKYVAVPFPDMATALAEHKVDAISGVEPFITSAELSGGAQPVISTCTGPTANFPISGDFALQSWTQKNPNTARAFQAAMTRGQALADASRANVEQILPTYIKSLDPDQSAVVNLGQFPTSLNETHLNRVVSLMQTDGLVGAKFSVAPLLFR
ncbi:MAG: ABC transporter substrate-binding protein [Streptosporangiaceae bacterium]